MPIVLFIYKSWKKDMRIFQFKHFLDKDEKMINNNNYQLPITNNKLFIKKFELSTNMNPL